jgi:hypothetical protein
MRDSLLLLGNGQSRTNLDSTGTICTNVLDLEQDSGSNAILTDDQVDTWCNVTITAYTYTSGGTEGLRFSARTDDASDLATAKDGVSAGYVDIGGIEVPLEELAVGKVFSFKCRKDIAKRYLGGWAAAVSTTLTGVIACDMEFSDMPITANESLQKVPS